MIGCLVGGQLTAVGRDLEPLGERMPPFLYCRKTPLGDKRGHKKICPGIRPRSAAQEHQALSASLITIQMI